MARFKTWNDGAATYATEVASGRFFRLEWLDTLSGNDWLAEELDVPGETPLFGGVRGETEAAALRSLGKAIDKADQRQLTSGDIARLLGVQPSTIRAYAARGQMPPADGRTGNTNWWWGSTVRRWRAGGDAPSPQRFERDDDWVDD
jgi:hypothetical protein